MTEYDPRDWYWLAAGDDKHVYSSSRATTVSMGDKAYKAWLAQGNVPTRIATMDELKAVLIAAGVVDVPQTISPRQFAQEAWSRSYMTYDEALAFAGAGTVPAALDALLNQLPDEQGKLIRLFIVGSLSYDRAHQATAAIGALWGLDSAGLDDFFRDAAKL